jgi:23S rRNA (cytidine1920-2'-O)/16S rRNA (cytidine1409-2'-O)-methyltransferase
MGRKGRPRLRTLLDVVARAYPSMEDPGARIAAGAIVVDGRVRTNPASLVREDASIALRRELELRGEAKLRAALAAFPVDVGGRVALDVGAAAGGFTRVLLEHGASRVYAVDAGYGQLLGSLRQDPRVVALERTNLAELDEKSVRDAVGVVTIDVSYLALARAVPQLGRVLLAPDADAVALVKPQFELGLARPPSDHGQLEEAVRRARRAFERVGWSVHRPIESPARGARGAIEYLLHATK